MKNCSLYLSFYVSTLLLSGCSQFDNTNVEIVKIIDGDTVIIKDDANQTHKVDLAYIDAPEREQPHGNAAKNFLKDKLLNKRAYVPSIKTPVELFMNDISINLISVEQGHSWVLPQIANIAKRDLFEAKQKLAISHLTGIWGLEHALRIAPWQWRKQAKAHAPIRTMNRRPSMKPTYQPPRKQVRPPPSPN